MSKVAAAAQWRFFPFKIGFSLNLDPPTSFMLFKLLNVHASIYVFLDVLSSQNKREKKSTKTDSYCLFLSFSTFRVICSFDLKYPPNLLIHSCLNIFLFTIDYYIHYGASYNHRFLPHLSLYRKIFRKVVALVSTLLIYFILPKNEIESRLEKYTCNARLIFGHYIKYQIKFVETKFHV